MDKRTLGAMIASLRKSREMTQSELAQKVGVTDKAVSKWERDVSYPDISLLPKLADIFGISVDELMRAETRPDVRVSKWEPLVSLILKALSLAMGIGVVVLSILKKIDLYSGLAMLGIGLTGVSLSLLREKEDRPS